ncbi:MAG TPA: UDP-N-acetylmuramoyl-L-alanine--D-glutamate ligase [Aliidongia sp.]|nr:UDP-N-acetylmuramoyl-L-alanine--D-glutamate ligase [Aliidongia sp.]
MITGLPFHNRPVAVLGLARSGLAAVEALEASGVRVLAWDDSPAAREAAAARGIALTDLGTADPAQWAALVMSPGIPLTHPTPHALARRAEEASVPVIGDIELLWLANTGSGFIGITGTNGKSTTTALIGHILSKTGKPVAVGGNLGTPVLSLPPLGGDGHYVIEMSSFQLDLIEETRFSVAILLNVTPDHLDRHGDMAGYVAAKRRIFRNQTAADTAIVAIDDDYCRTVADGLAARTIRISAERAVAGGIYALDGRLIDDSEGRAETVMDLAAVPSLPGRHNWQNAAAAYAAARSIGLAPAEIAAAIASFPGLAHRQELVGRLGKLRFVNDSKATNADAAAKALGCYEPIYWIAGGVAKAGGIEPLRDYFPRIRHAYLIGEATEAFAATLEGSVPVSRCGTLGPALRAAGDAARTDPAEAPVVLLSPACASFDQYRNFEIRGDEFRRLVGTYLAEAAS